MSFSNPTPIRIGMTGTFEGRRFRVAGRVVMGMDDNGEIYYWNEFNLVSDDGGSATLVYEETEHGGEWRLFTMFEPEYPMTAADAATKRVGDRLNLDGTDMRVTLVDESRVYHIEGEAPEGVEVDDVAHYFNLETGSEMQVVSWTGDEVEYYRGVNLARGLVAGAFGLRTDQFRLALPTGSISGLLGGQASSGLGLGVNVSHIIGAVFVLVFLLVVISPSCRSYSRRSNPAKIAAPALPLMNGSEGKLGDRTFRVQAHALMEIARDGQIFDRHEYQLVDDEGNAAALVNGLLPQKREWFLFTPRHPLDPMSPQQAGALRVGDVVNVDGYVAPVTELIRCTVLQADVAEPAAEKTGTVYYGFVARSDRNILLVRWNEAGIIFLRSPAVPEEDVIRLFVPKAAQ